MGGSLKTVLFSNKTTWISFKGINQKQFQLFLISILWRASVSTHEVYSKIYLSKPLREEIRVCLLEDKKIRSSLISIKISRLSDSTKNDFSLSTLIGVVNPNNKVLFIPYLDIFDIPEIVRLVVSGYRKYIKGQTRIKS